jgi:hypothetical protein
MSSSKSGLWTVLFVVLLLAPAASFADTNCEAGNGALNTAQPQGVTPQEIIQKFAAREELFTTTGVSALRTSPLLRRTRCARSV